MYFCVYELNHEPLVDSNFEEATFVDFGLSSFMMIEQGLWIQVSVLRHCCAKSALSDRRVRLTFYRDVERQWCADS